jgi:hypothetical protein
MPGTMALRAQNLAVLRIEPDFGELRERVNVVNMKDNLRTATIANRPVVNSALLALVAAQFKGFAFPFSVLNRASQPDIFGGFAALPVAI